MKQNFNEVEVNWTPEEGTIISAPDLNIRVSSKITQNAISYFKQKLKEYYNV